MINEELIRQYLSSVNIVPEENTSQFILDCPICGKENKVYMGKANGIWDCKSVSCPAHVSNGASTFDKYRQETSKTPATTKKEKIKIDPSKIEKWKINLTCSISGKEYLYQRKIKPETALKYNLGLTEWGQLVVPHYANNKLQIAQIKNISGEKYFYYTEGTTYPWNYDCVDETTDELVIVEGAIDALSCIEYGNTKVWGMPGCGSPIRPEYLEKLKNVKKIYIAYDIGDKHNQGDIGADKLVKVLGYDRCYRVILPKHDMNDCLKSGVSVKQIIDCIKNAKQFDVEGVADLGSLLDGAIFLAQNEGEIVGASTGYPKLDKLLLGIRPEEYTLVAGYDNVGKTTFLSTIVMNLARQKIPVYMFSFETPPKKLLASWIAAWYQKDVKNLTSDDLRIMGKQFIHEAPLKVWDWDKPVDLNSIEKLESYLKFLRDRYGIKHVVIDALPNIMLSRRGRINDAIRDDDSYLAGLQQLVRKLGIHIFGTVHLKKPDGHNKMPTKYDIKGTGGAGYFCDNILIVHRDMDYTADASYLQEVTIGVARNRFSGDLGFVVMKYDKQTKTYTEI